MSIKKILFRADSSSTIGTGHIMRDLVLASKYKNANITFATRELKGNINHQIIKSNYKLKILKSNSKQELVKLIKKLSIGLLIIDNYALDYKQEKYIKKKTGVKILSLDDTYEKHYCDILLNHNISATKSRYKGLVPKWCKLRCGSKYTLLRDEFKKEKNQYYKSNKKFTIFIAMGGADHSNINIKILKVLKKYKNIKVNVVTTKANKHLKQLQKYSKNKNWIKLYVDSTKIAKLMKKANLSIVTPSVTLNEVYFLKKPFIAIKTADNQRDMYDFLKKNDKDVLKKFDKQKFIKKLELWINK
jgi:UDP-2,4-diacetamido-2,4,6-trideoxy-beta-L-altropyranose hydrolase